MRKGQGPFISHTLLAGILLIVIVVISTSLITMHSHYSSFLINEQSKSICNVIRGAVIDFSPANDYYYETDTLYGKIWLNLPSRLGGQGYNIRFDYLGAKKILNITADTYAFECGLPDYFEYSGRSGGGLTELQFIQNDNSRRVMMG